MTKIQASLTEVDDVLYAEYETPNGDFYKRVIVYEEDFQAFSIEEGHIDSLNSDGDAIEEIIVGADDSYMGVTPYGEWFSETPAKEAYAKSLEAYELALIEVSETPIIKLTKTAKAA